jgi:hypothetical protein
MRVNSDTGSNYNIIGLTSSGATVAYNDAATTWIQVYEADNTPTTSGQNTFVLNFPNYTNTDGYKTFNYNGWNKTSPEKSRSGTGVWKSASAITAINFNTNVGTATFSGTYTLYGVK